MVQTQKLIRAVNRYNMLSIQTKNIPHFSFKTNVWMFSGYDLSIVQPYPFSMTPYKDPRANFDDHAFLSSNDT